MSQKQKEASRRHTPARRYRHVLTGIIATAVCALTLWFVWVTDTYLPRADGAVIEVTLPDLVGQPCEAVLPTLREDWYDVAVEYRADEDSLPGTVLSQLPGAGDTRRIRPGDSRCHLTLTVSTGRASYTLPDLTGYEVREAADLLRRAGLSTVRREVTRTDLTPGQVVETRPPAGSILHPGESVTLWESRTPPVRTVTVPDVTGKEASAANLQLLLLGLKPAGTVSAASDRPAGTVLSQRPLAGATVTAGSPVYLTVSDGSGTLFVPEEAPSPSLLSPDEETPRSTPEDLE